MTCVGISEVVRDALLPGLEGAHEFSYGALYEQRARHPPARLLERFSSPVGPFFDQLKDIGRDTEAGLSLALRENVHEPPQKDSNITVETYHTRDIMSNLHFFSVPEPPGGGLRDSSGLVEPKIMTSLGKRVQGFAERVAREHAPEDIFVSALEHPERAAEIRRIALKSLQRAAREAEDLGILPPRVLLEQICSLLQAVMPEQRPPFQEQLAHALGELVLTAVEVLQYSLEERAS